MTGPADRLLGADVSRSTQEGSADDPRDLDLGEAANLEIVRAALVDREAVITNAEAAFDLDAFD